MSERGTGGDPGREEIIRRILVAIDASPHSLTALNAAAELAAQLDAEIQGIYVEDIHLLRFAEFPLAREITFFSVQPRPFDRREAEHQLRTQARAARRALENLAAREHLRWTFQVAQGVVHEELLAAALESDLIILGRVGWSRRRRLGSTARSILLQAQRPALILQSGARLTLPLGVVYDGSDQARRALRAAANLTRDRAAYLTVIILADSPGQAQKLQAEVAERLREWDLQARFRWQLQADLSSLRELIRAEGCGVLVIPGGIAALQGEIMAEFVNEINCPVMLVR